MPSDIQLSQLLPRCSVSIFTDSPAHIRALTSLSSDWRMANVAIETHTGGMAAAQKLYMGAQKTPDIVIVETTDADVGNLLSALETLAQQCSDNTAAILIGPENDVDLYKRLTRMGVRDYLVAPATPQRLLEAIAAATLAGHGIAENELTVVIGARGGVGTSTVASLIAHGFAASLSRKTALCDLLPGRSPLPVIWGTECPGGLADLGKAFKSADVDQLYRLCPKVHDMLHIFTPAADTPFDFALGHDEQAELLQGLRAHFPVLVYDTAGFTPKMLRTIIPTAPHVVLVTTPCVTGLRAARRMMDQIQPLRGGDATGLRVVINRVGEMGGEELSPRDIAAALGTAPAASIVYDRTTLCAFEMGRWQSAPAITKTTAALMAMLGHKSLRAPVSAPRGWLARLGLEE